MLYVPNAVQIKFRAGYGDAYLSSPFDGTYLPPDGLPEVLLTAVQQLVAGWYEHRESISPLSLKEMPNHLKALLWSKKVFYYSNTRG